MLFFAADIATVLGYAKARNAVQTHCPHALKRGVGVQTGLKADGTPAFQTVMNNQKWCYLEVWQPLKKLVCVNNYHLTFLR